MIVVDTNIITYRLVQGDKTNLVIKAQEKDNNWILPTLWKHEFLNVLSFLTKQNILNKDQSQLTWNNSLRLFSDSEKQIKLIDALNLSVEKNISGYDAQFIVLAKSHGIRCLTEDKKLQNIFPQTAISLNNFCKE